MLLCLGLTLALPASVLAFPRSCTVAVFAAPGAEFKVAVGIVERAGGVLLRVDQGDRFLLAHSDRAGFALRLYAAGAWLVLDPVLVGGCDPKSAASFVAPVQGRSPA